MSTVFRSCLVVMIGLIILSSFPTPGQAAGMPAGLVASTPTVRLRIKNQMGVVLTKLVLTGPKTYVFYSIPLAHSDYVIEKGHYRIEYTSCGIKRSFIVDLKGELTRLVIAKCKSSKLSVINQTGGTMIFSLTGPANYQFKLQPGTTRLLIIHGTFRYSMSAQCGSKNGRLEINRRIHWVWTCTQPNVLHMKYWQ